MKLLLKIVAVLVVLVVLGLGAVFVSIDAIAKGAIEKGATYALGVQTTLGSVDVGVFRGEFSMSGLDVANPEGFDADHFLRLGEGRTTVDLGTLRQDLVELPYLTLSNVILSLEKKAGSSNYGVILEHLQGLESGAPRGEKDPGAGGGKRFVIREVVITDVNVQADLLGIGGDLNHVSIPIDEIRLTNVGSDGINTSELTNVIIKAIMAAVMANAGDLPAELINDLGGGLQNLQGLDAMGIDLTAEVGGQMTAVTQQTLQNAQNRALDILKDAGVPDNISKSIGGTIGKSIGDIFGGTKDD